MTFLSYAQNFEDVLLWRALQSVERGCYVDVGAQHPDTDSVTRAFYERGWRGLNIEPSSEYAALLRAARPGDITLELALGAEPGELPFLDVPGTGLSTLDRTTAERLSSGPFLTRTRTVEVSTLAEVFRRHVSGPVHFLKIDVEGAERAVLEGADLWAARPWIILVEATVSGGTEPSHERWEELLLRWDYVFVWFDGLNRFYLAAEHSSALRPYFLTPPNVFDDFVRSAEGTSFARIAAAETELASLRRALAERDRDLVRFREQSSRDAHILSRQREQGHAAAAASEETARLQATLLHLREHELHHTHLRLRDALVSLEDARREAEEADALADRRQAQLAAIKTSRSWMLTSPLRGAGRFARRLAKRDRSAEGIMTAIADAAIDGKADTNAVVSAVRDTDTSPDELARPPLPLSPPPPAPGQLPIWPVGVVHQFHSGSAVGDAITNAMLLTRQLLRAAGFESEIYTEQPAAGLEHELKPLDLIPRHDRYVLIMRHSMGYDRFAEVLDLPARKILLYHNITPAAFLRRHPVLEHYAELGRQQLSSFRGRVEAVLADSDYNLVELYRLGLGPAERCTLLFDPEILKRRVSKVADYRTAETLFTVLFVGRVVDSKNQLLLVDAFARFRTEFGLPTRLVLVGRHEDGDDPYVRSLQAKIADPQLGRSVELAGAVDDDTLDRLYAASDLYVSASRHEGFGVTLVEAMAHGVPILAWPAGAVQHTVRGAARWLEDLQPAAIASAMLDLARDPEARERLRRAGYEALERFELPGQMETLQRALLRAGAEPPRLNPLRERLAETLRISVCGHVNGSYSLAVINRELVRRLDAGASGRVRLQAFENGPTTDLRGVPEVERATIGALARRPPPMTGPELVVSQHYPIHVPEPRGEVTAALLFWEETLLPRHTIEALSDNFDVAVAPTHFVARALIDSGCRIPVRIIPPAVTLDRFEALRGERRPKGSPHCFLHVSSCFPRKGVDVLLRAWARAFSADDPVCLVIKGFPNPHNEVEEMIAASLRVAPSQAPIEFINRDLDGEDLLALYRRADTMVLPTRGEGLNLPAAEAMAAGLALIVTDGGGHMDFCLDAQGRQLPGVTLLPARPDVSGSHLATPFSQWLEPDEDVLIASLRKAAANAGVGGTVTMPTTPAFPNAEDLTRRYTDLALDALLGSAVLRRPVRVSWVSTWNLRCGVAEYSRHLLTAIEARATQILAVRVLCDKRTPRDDAYDPENRYWPCWNIGDERSAAPIIAAIAADDADAVVIQHQPGLISFATLAALGRNPALAGRVCIATLHNTRHLLDLDADAIRDAIDGLSNFDRVVVHTATDQALLRELGLRTAVTLLPQGIPAMAAPDTLSPIRSLIADPTARSQGLAGSGPLIGCYGFLLPGKGVPELIEAFALLREKWPDARLALVNALHDHPESHRELKRCQDLIAANGLNDVVMLQTAFLPHEESLKLLRSCDVIALPYRPSKESSSAAMRSALSSGTPVAVTDINLFAEAEDAVFRFAADDPLAIAAGLDSLLSDDYRRRALRAAAAKWIAARDWDGVSFRFAGMVAGLVRSHLMG